MIAQRIGRRAYIVIAVIAIAAFLPFLGIRVASRIEYFEMVRNDSLRNRVVPRITIWPDIKPTITVETATVRTGLHVVTIPAADEVKYDDYLEGWRTTDDSATFIFFQPFIVEEGVNDFENTRDYVSTPLRSTVEMIFASPRDYANHLKMMKDRASTPLGEDGIVTGRGRRFTFLARDSQQLALTEVTFWSEHPGVGQVVLLYGDNKNVRAAALQRLTAAYSVVLARP
jgi:hypothetical protein